MILGTNTDITVNIFLDGNEIEKFMEFVLLGRTIDNKLRFKTHIQNIFRSAKYKLHVLQRIRKYLSIDKAKTLCNAFISSQFYYAPFNLDVFREVVNLKSAKNPFSIASSGT